MQCVSFFLIHFYIILFVLCLISIHFSSFYTIIKIVYPHSDISTAFNDLILSVGRYRNPLEMCCCSPAKQISEKMFQQHVPVASRWCTSRFRVKSFFVKFLYPLFFKLVVLKSVGSVLSKCVIFMEPTHLKYN